MPGTLESPVEPSVVSLVDLPADFFVEIAGFGTQIQANSEDLQERRNEYIAKSLETFEIAFSAVLDSNSACALDEFLKSLWKASRQPVRSTGVTWMFGIRY